MIKTIIKGRSPTMRHVSRTRRVALDWLFDRINLDSKIQIRYIDTKRQIACILTEGNFTRVEWNNILHFSTSAISALFATPRIPAINCPQTVAKRMQEQKGEERSVAKSKSAGTSLSSHVPASSSTAKIPIASKSPEILTAAGKAARCILWRVDGKGNGETCRNKRIIS